MKKLILLSLLISFPASAQVVQPRDMKVACMPTEHFRNVMRDHKESPAILGVTSAGRLFEVWVSRDGKTWTAAISDGPSKMTCAFADGEGIEIKPGGEM